MDDFAKRQFDKESRSVLWGLWVGFFLVLVCAFTLACCHPVHADVIPRDANHYRSTLVRAAHAGMGLDAPIATLAAQVHQESRWRVDAKSPVGAQGLAQFMPATAEWLAEIYPHSIGTADPFNPGWSLRAMVAYNKWLLVRVRAHNNCERWAMALSAYNGGLGWVYRDRALSREYGADDLAWFDSIEPHNAGRSEANFAENRHYVRVVLLRFEPLYVRQGWGHGVCGERYANKARF